MTTSVNDETIRLKTKELLVLGIGISVEIAGQLYIRDLDNGDYAVGGNIPRNENDYNEWIEWEETFTDLDKALEFFIFKRNEGKIGDDFWVNDETQYP